MYTLHKQWVGQQRHSTLQRQLYTPLQTPAVILSYSLLTEPYGRLGKPAMGLLNTLATTCATGEAVKDTFVCQRTLGIKHWIVQRQWSVALLRFRCDGMCKGRCVPGRNDCANVRRAVRAQVTSVFVLALTLVGSPQTLFFSAVKKNVDRVRAFRKYLIGGKTMNVASNDCEI